MIAALRALSLTAAALALSACVSLLPDAEPSQLYRLEAAIDPAVTVAPPAPTFGLVLPSSGFVQAASGDRILTVEGKRGLNAFASTELDETLKDRGIEHVVLSGAVTSICIDSTGRAAHERGYRVSVLSDCTASRTPYEQEFYCENIFPLYAEVLTSEEFLNRSSGE